ncbi:hypothetical protein D3C78_769230 [compost metagenome]
MRLNLTQQPRAHLIEGTLGGRLPSQMQCATALHGREIMPQGAGFHAQALGRFIKAEVQPRLLDRRGGEKAHP